MSRPVGSTVTPTHSNYLCRCVCSLYYATNECMSGAIASDERALPSIPPLSFSRSMQRSRRGDFVSYSRWRLIQFAACGTQKAVGQDQVVGVVEGWKEVEDLTDSH